MLEVDFNTEMTIYQHILIKVLCQVRQIQLYFKELHTTLRNPPICNLRTLYLPKDT